MKTPLINRTGVRNDSIARSAVDDMLLFDLKGTSQEESRTKIQDLVQSLAIHTLEDIDRMRHDVPPPKDNKRKTPETCDDDRGVDCCPVCKIHPLNVVLCDCRHQVCTRNSATAMGGVPTPLTVP